LEDGERREETGVRERVERAPQEAFHSTWRKKMKGERESRIRWKDMSDDLEKARFKK